MASTDMLDPQTEGGCWISGDNQLRNDLLVVDWAHERFGLSLSDADQETIARANREGWQLSKSLLTK